MKTFILLISCFLLWSCSDNFNDTGTANGMYDGTVLEYLQGDKNNWKLTVELIERAGLQPLFEGRDPEYSQITFFAPTSFSILQFLLKTTDTDGNRLYQTITDVPVETCQEIVLSHVVPNRYLRKDFEFEIKGTLEGGSELITLTGLRLRVYRFYIGRPNIDPDGIGFHFTQSGHIGIIASGDIQPLTGVVHSIDYTYQLLNPVMK